MNRISALAAAASVGLTAALAPAGDVSVTVDTDTVTHQIDPKIYGHFYEHIYHSANGGLWGNVVWNRSFEESAAGAGAWERDGDTIRQTSRAENVTLAFGDANWGDVDYTLQARKLGGAEGFLVPFRVNSDRDFYWLNIGGWGNSQHAIEGADGGPKRLVGQPIPGRVEEGRWYDIRVRVEGDRMQAWLDGEQLFDVNLGSDQTPTGKAGIGTWATAAEYRNLVVKDLDGAELYSGLPEQQQSRTLAAHLSQVHVKYVSGSQSAAASDGAENFPQESDKTLR